MTIDYYETNSLLLESDRIDDFLYVAIGREGEPAADNSDLSGGIIKDNVNIPFDRQESLIRIGIFVCPVVCREFTFCFNIFIYCKNEVFHCFYASC